MFCFLEIVFARKNSDINCSVIFLCTFLSCDLIHAVYLLLFWIMKFYFVHRMMNFLIFVFPPFFFCSVALAAWFCLVFAELCGSLDLFSVPLPHFYDNIFSYFWSAFVRLYTSHEYTILDAIVLLAKHVFLELIYLILSGGHCC